MSRGIARLGDRTLGKCTCHSPDRNNMGGTIITASTDTFANGRGVARHGDKVKADCGHMGTIVSASELSESDSAGIACLGDKTTGCYKAVIITASPDTFTN